MSKRYSFCNELESSQRRALLSGVDDGISAFVYVSIALAGFIRLFMEKNKI